MQPLLILKQMLEATYDPGVWQPCSAEGHRVPTERLLGQSQQPSVVGELIDRLTRHQVSRACPPATIQDRPECSQKQVALGRRQNLLLNLTTVVKDVHGYSSMYCLPARPAPKNR
ncbi:MAG: hypothetical protein WBE37_26050 [Bryobacteraceae bacterium]